MCLVRLSNHNLTVCESAALTKSVKSSDSTKDACISVFIDSRRDRLQQIVRHDCSAEWRDEPVEVLLLVVLEGKEGEEEKSEIAQTPTRKQPACLHFRI